MKNATELLMIYRIGQIIGIISIIAFVNYVLKKLNSELFDVNFF
ncbi:MAG: hypothetical protein Q7J16_00440 [Candidatus Cloacimonadales bacterium]|nr:hypothetical protein [Candidatus Cloacimonadales bacterium]